MTEEGSAPAESLSERARRLYDGGFSSTARALLWELNDTMTADELIEVILPWVADRVRAAIRMSVRQVEEDAFASPAGKAHGAARSIRTQAGALPALDNLELLLGLPVLVPGLGTVCWRDMTVEHHQARIGMLRRPLSSIRDAIGRHEWSIREIGKYGVRCLGDIDPAVLRADMRIT